MNKKKDIDSNMEGVSGSKDQGTDTSLSDLNQNDGVLKDASGRLLCKVTDCDQVAQVDGRCRYHYVLFWNSIQDYRDILKGDKFRDYIAALIERYSDKYVEALCNDLESEGSFIAALQELGYEAKVARKPRDMEDSPYGEEMLDYGSSSSEDKY